MSRRVVVIGKNLLAVRCLGTVRRAGDEIVLAVADSKDEGRDGWQPSFRRAASELGLPTEDPANVNDPAFVAHVDELAPDFLLSFQAPQILRSPLIATARVASINLHFGPLPRYRGVAPIAWAIINGETSTGVTLHHIDPGIDSGAVIRTEPVVINHADTGRTLYDKCTEAGIKLFEDGWPTIRSGMVDAVVQEEHEALYYNRHSIDFRERRISWHWDARRVADWARAMIFPPFQYPALEWRGEQYDVTGVRCDRAPHRGRPGEVLGREGDLLVVGAPGGRLTIGPLDVAGSPLDGAALEARGLVTGAQLARG